MARDEEKGRIAELEAEVAALKAQLDTRGEDDPGGAELPPGDEMAAAGPSRAKVIAVAGIIICAVLGLMLAIYTALATGFDHFAEEAADRLAPIVTSRPQSTTKQKGVEAGQSPQPKAQPKAPAKGRGEKPAPQPLRPPGF